MNRSLSVPRLLRKLSGKDTPEPTTPPSQQSCRRLSIMEYTRLGDSGLKISKVILGAMTYGTPDWQAWVLDEEKALPLLQHAYQVGLNTWDTVCLPTLSTSHFANDNCRRTYTPMVVPKRSSAKQYRNTKSPVKS